MMNRIATTLILISSLATAACQTMQESGGVKTYASGARNYATTADWRMITTARRGANTITCTEPSPDIAKIASNSSSFSFNGSAKGIAKVQPEVAMALAATHAESLAQLGKRLATVQLLRDAMYRACEAYGNGAINEAAYSMILSRYDDVMVTMLMGELAGDSGSGNTLALLTSQASVEGLPPAEQAVMVNELNTQVKAARDLVKIKEKALADAKAATPKVEANITAAQGELDKAKTDQKKIEDAILEFVGKSGSIRPGASGTAGGGGGGGGERNADIADALADMQRTYLHDRNSDGVMVGCMTALADLDDRIMENGQVVSSRQYSNVLTQPAANKAFNLQDTCRNVLGDGQMVRTAANGEIMLNLLNALGKKDLKAMTPTQAAEFVKVLKGVLDTLGKRHDDKR